MNNNLAIDKIGQKYIPYFDDYCNNLVDISNDKDIELNFISYNSDIKLKNITKYKCFIYTYSDKNICYDKLDLTNIKVLFGYIENGVQVYFDNYFNISLCIKDSHYIYIKRNNRSFPLLCFYSGKFNFKGKLFDYELNKNCLRNVSNKCLLDI